MSRQSRCDRASSSARISVAEDTGARSECCRSSRDRWLLEGRDKPWKMAWLHPVHGAGDLHRDGGFLHVTIAGARLALLHFETPLHFHAPEADERERGV